MKSQQLVDLPANMFLFVPCAERPSRDDYERLGISHVAAIIHSTPKGPSGTPGWLLTPDGDMPERINWLQIGEMWIGVARTLKKRTNPLTGMKREKGA